MNKQDMRRLAELAQDFYNEKQGESGMITPIRKAWASNEEEGLLIIVSTFGVHSRELARQTGIPWKGDLIPPKPNDLKGTYKVEDGSVTVNVVPLAYDMNDEELKLAKNIGGQMDNKILCPRQCNRIYDSDSWQHLSTVGDMEDTLFCPHCELDIDIVVKDL